MPGSHEDAILIVELVKWGTMSGLPEAAGTVFADDFDPDAAEANDPAVRTVLAFNETGRPDWVQHHVLNHGHGR